MTVASRYGNSTLNRGLFLLAIPAALCFLMACGGPAPTPNIPIGPAATEPATATSTPPTATPPPTVAPSPANTPTQPPATRAATTRPAAAVRPTETPPPTATEPPATATPAAPESDAEEVAAIRRIVYDYWVALNDYDVDLALTMLEDGYRAQEEESIRSDIGQLKLFRAKLEVSEETPPAINAEGDYETYLTLGTPVDTRRVLMVFRHIDGRWRIVFSGEIE